MSQNVRNPAIQDALVEYANSEAISAAEAEEIFSDIACTLDNKYNSQCDSNLSPKQYHALRIFSKDLAEVASRYFEAYIRGVSAGLIGSKLTHPAGLTPKLQHQLPTPTLPSVADSLLHTPLQGQKLDPL
ncbi:hypothetical protein GcM1_106001 [Golovinomyces cichoracearum]|uniref:Uncharacterized protein n=1 Tax=Golovinomyces cichoracearum TaxID=62708 RepID=A0A420JC59_9PEZI|nr:hypothetical protein GcM1_106001 [Golovinomyces cichoracearum]